MTDENEPTTPGPAPLENESPKEPESRWARLDELDPAPDDADDDRLKGLPPPPMFG